MGTQGGDVTQPPLTEHFTRYVEDVKELKRRGRLGDAETLLTALIAAVEDECRRENRGVAPGYYEQLAIVRRKRGDFEGEIAILERFAAQRHAPGMKPDRLLQRLKTARAHRA